MPGGEAKEVKEIKVQSTKFKWLFLAVIFLSFFFLAGCLSLLARLPPQVIARGVNIAQFDMGGLTKEQALKIISSPAETLENQGLNFVYKNISYNLSSVVHSLSNPELSVAVFAYDREKTVEEAFEKGRQGALGQKLFERFYFRLSGKKISPIFFLEEKEVRNFLTANFSIYEVKKREAGFKIDFQNGVKVEISPESPGRIFDYDSALEEMKNRLANFGINEVFLKLKEDRPKVVRLAVEKIKPELEKILAQGDLNFYSADKNFVVPREEWSQWLEAVPDEGSSSLAKLAVSVSLMEKFIKEKVVPQIETTFEEAKFAVEDGKVTEFRAGTPGKKINLDALTLVVSRALLQGGERNIQLVLETINPQMTLEKVNDLGIKELVGVGQTNFKGSPANRRHNIKIGAALLNGVLIAPGEEMSLIKKLSPINAQNGYLPELVIKDNKTIPEYGGGLCQISTTMFRVSLNAGLPILERSNHAYRVPYYEPPVGVDATIYDPRPDFRILNDTGRYLLLQTKIEGNDLIFELWGAKDGRQATQTEPKKFNYRAPPPAKLVETLDLPAGKKKCTEKAHAGLDTVFTYTVVYPNGEVKTQDFKSHFKPWGEVCLIGVEKLGEPVLDNDMSVNSSSTTKENPL